jgi:hypothetical protein
VIYHQTAPFDEGNNLYKMEIEHVELPCVCLDDKLCQFMVGEQCHFKRPKRLWLVHPVTSKTGKILWSWRHELATTIYKFANDSVWLLCCIKSTSFDWKISHTQTHQNVELLTAPLPFKALSHWPLIKIQSIFLSVTLRRRSLSLFTFWPCHYFSLLQSLQSM